MPTCFCPPPCRDEATDTNPRASFRRSTPASAPSRPAAGRRILLIEDHRDAADSMRMLLDLVGYEARVAYTGPEGIRLALEWGPDVVLSDIGLPGLDGYEVARQLRLNPATYSARLIAVTGYGSDEACRRSREAGFEQHLLKPVDPADLLLLLGKLDLPTHKPVSGLTQ